ncbi:hypothetical protein [Thalassolituus sp.]|jgi:hypothetical protein|uniref:hypothetical protein n=1 Tax=Thalassolituus sp. TaxID=2030822 RepID=UPI0035127C9B
MEVHPYIKLIKFAIENRSFTVEQACMAAHISREEFMFVRHELFVLSGAQQEPVISHQQVMDWKVSPQALFGYIQYQAYRDAVESASKADQRALIATRISIGALVVGSSIGILGIIF